MGLGRVQRRPEIDALRGVFLVWMTLAHLPTHLSDLVNEPFGFVSSAEGFVFLSALLVARLYIRQAAESGAVVRTKLWKRALRIYGYHLVLLAFAFTMAASFGVIAHRLALTNLLNFYLAHPLPAVVGSLLLIYCPPLLDILPMYVIFLLITPFLLATAAHRGWKGILLASGSVWLLAQFGLRAWVHDVVVRITTLQIPLQDTGAFNLFAWQMVWISGLCIGAISAREGRLLWQPPRFLYEIGALICIFFIGVRHNWLGSYLTQQALGMQLDKWQLGSLRVVNLIAFACVIYGSRKLLDTTVRDRALRHAWQGVAPGLLRPPGLRLCRPRTFIWHGQPASRVRCDRVSGVYLCRSDIRGCSRASTQETGTVNQSSGIEDQSASHLR